MTQQSTCRARRTGRSQPARLSVAALGVLVLIAWITAPLCAVACVETLPSGDAAETHSASSTEAQPPCHGAASEPGSSDSTTSGTPSESTGCDCAPQTSIAARPDAVTVTAAVLLHASIANGIEARWHTAPQTRAPSQTDLPPPSIILLHATLLI